MAKSKEKFTRSVNGKEAIKNFELPLSMIEKNQISKFLEKNKENFTKKEIKRLEDTNYKQWRFVAQKIIGPTSWHHATPEKLKINHYDLHLVAPAILQMGGNLEKEYDKACRNGYKSKGIDVHDESSPDPSVVKKTITTAISENLEPVEVKCVTAEEAIHQEESSSDKKAITREVIISLAHLSLPNIKIKIDVFGDVSEKDICVSLQI